MSGDLGIIDLSNDSSDGEEPVMSLADKVRLRLGGPSQLLHAGQVEDQLPLEFLEDEEIVTVSTHIDLALVDLPESSDADVPSDSSGRDENQSENNSNHRSTFNSQGTDFTKTASSGGAKGRKRRSPEEIAVERQSKLLKKEAAAQLKMQKQMEKEAEIRAKVIGKEKQRAIQPKESVKYVTVVVDPQVLQFPETTTVLTQLSANEYSYAVESQPAPKVILWKRRLVECEGNPERDGNGEVSRIEDEILRLVELSSFVDMVKAHSSGKQSQNQNDEETSLEQIATVTRRIYGENKRVSLVVIGMETYFRNLCTLQNRKHREAVLKTVATPADTQIKQGAKAAPMPKGLRNIQTLITRVELELFTIHLQIRCNLSVFYAETAEEFGDLIVRFTKSVCEAPYKQLKKGMSALKDGDFADLFCEADGGKGCKIERDGRGSLEVWRRMLCQYPWVSAEMASAIVQVHGSPKQLLDAYTQARNVSEAEMFLQDIMIRRGAGLVATQRRVGPEASRKIYAAITAVDGELIIGKKD